MVIPSAPPTSGTLAWRDTTVVCALGRGGVSADKREGDGTTPAGLMPLRYVLFRPDRLAAPPSRLPVRPITPQDGWCDDPARSEYNRPVSLPFAGHHEVLWRADRVYDVIVVLGWNDAPAVPDKGSAIFMHVARPDFSPTEGCVALTQDDLLRLLADCGPGDRLKVNLSRS
ncbi:MAG: hypothetical protein FJX42_03700 [Alphaproteobacteria bacterium]|nr:hypothetical protein [Alphaproteobacteria bacterium]